MNLALVDTNTGEILESAPTFDDFWTLYPRRVAKKCARQAWGRLSDGQRMAALVALVDWRRVWAGKDIEYLPHPATWINGERWEDEVPAEYRRSAASHMDAKLPEQTQRTAMPDHVKQLIAKLRRG